MRQVRQSGWTFWSCCQLARRYSLCISYSDRRSESLLSTFRFSWQSVLHLPHRSERACSLRNRRWSYIELSRKNTIKILEWSLGSFLNAEVECDQILARTKTSLWGAIVIAYPQQARDKKTLLILVMEIVQWLCSFIKAIFRSKTLKW